MENSFTSFSPETQVKELNGVILEESELQHQKN